MSPEIVSILVAVFFGLAGLIFGVWSFIVRRRDQKDARLITRDEKQTEHSSDLDRRLARLETKIEQIPEAAQLKALSVSLAKLEGKIDVNAKQAEYVKEAVDKLDTEVGQMKGYLMELSKSAFRDKRLPASTPIGGDQS